MKYKIIYILVLFPFTLLAQDSTRHRAPWEKLVMVRKGLETKDDKDKPAIFSLTWPKDGKANSYLVNAAIALNFAQAHGIGNYRRRIEITPSFVYNRNNQIKKEQHNLKGVVAVDYLVGKEDNAANTHTYLKVYPTLQYMRNKIDTSSSFFATAYVAWVLKTKYFSLNEYHSIANSGLLWYLGPALGYEYQDRFNVKKPGTNGGISRFYFGGDMRLAFKDAKDIKPNAQGKKKRSLGIKLFEATMNYAGRKQISSSMPVSEGFTYLFKAGFDYFPLRNETLSIGISYTDGEDPIAAVEKQKFWQLAFKLKLDYPIKK